MKKNVCIFGSNSVIACDFIDNYSNLYEFIRIQRTNTSFVKENNLKVEFDLSKNHTKSKIFYLMHKINEFRKSDVLVFILFAWAGKPRDLDLKNKISFKENQNILNNFISISKICNPTQIIFISTAGAIYNQNTDKLSKETDIPLPTSEYGIQKLSAEKILTSYCNGDNIKFTILRIASAFGHNSLSKEQGVINKWLFNIKRNEPIKVYNSLDSKINFISFKNISLSINSVINMELTGIYNIGSTQSTSLKEILSNIKIVTKKDKLLIEQVDNKLRLFYLDTSIFQEKTNLKFQNNFLLEIKTLFSLIENY